MRRLAVKPPLAVVIAVSAIAFFGGLSVVFEPWADNKAVVAVNYRFCNVVLPIFPEHSEVKVSARPKYGPAVTRVLISTTRESAVSLIIVDPESGELELEDVRSAVEKQLLHEVMQSIRVVRTMPEFWPYTRRTQFEPEFDETEYFRYRLPDPGAGLVVLQTSGSHGGGFGLTVQNCRSYLALFQRGRNGELEVVKDEVHPDDRAAFDTFIAEIEPK